MVEADRHLNLLPASILEIYKVFLHIDMLFIGMYSSSLKQSFPHHLAQILGFWVPCRVKMMSLCHGGG